MKFKSHKLSTFLGTVSAVSAIITYGLVGSMDVGKEVEYIYLKLILCTVVFTVSALASVFFRYVEEYDIQRAKRNRVKNLRCKIEMAKIM